MKFVVWGAGMLGRRLRHFLGNQVLAYIDSKTSYQGQERDGIPVFSFEEYIRRKDTDYASAWIIVSPRDFIDEIYEKLSKAKIEKFFVLTDAVNNFYDYSLVELLDKMAAYKTEEDEVYMDGMDVFHAIMYEKLLSCNLHPVIWIPANRWEREQKRRKALAGWDIRRSDEGHAIPFVDDEEILRGMVNIYANPKMKKFHNMYRGHRCFVVATGPSLRMEDLEILHAHEEICISMNGIFHAFPHVKWRPNFFMMGDALMIRYREIIDHMDVPYRIITDSNPDFWKMEHPSGVYRLHNFTGNVKNPKESFSDDLVQGVYGNSTVTNSCLQMAVYLGCEKIYLLGADFSQLLGKKDRNSHFIKDYDHEMRDEDYSTFYTDEQLQDLMLRGYQAARHYADTHPPLKIYNATRGGYLEVFERIDFDSLF